MRQYGMEVIPGKERQNHCSTGVQRLLCLEDDGMVMGVKDEMRVIGLKDPYSIRYVGFEATSRKKELA